MREKRIIEIEDTQFIYERNLAGDPEKSGKFRSTTRYVNVIIPSEEQAMAMMEEGINVKCTKPREGFEEEYIKKFFVKCIANYKSQMPPAIYLVMGNSAPVLLDEQSVNQIDMVYVLNVKVALNPWYSEVNDTTSCYIAVMYVEAEQLDPFQSMYER